MQVTANLSKAFHDRFREQIVNEVVGWFNKMDATFRTDVRELNELNYVRFEAKLKQRLAELRAELMTAIAALRTDMEHRVADQSSEAAMQVVVGS
ncbi:MAG TPA: hypothetical protein VGL65_14070 [Gemmatimonadales bacterium]|jgi:hypothetical protein